MTQEEYLALQQQNIETAITLGRSLLRVSAGLHGVAADASEEVSANQAAKGYIRDAFQYYNFNDSAAAISREPALLNQFKQSLIDIKIANDKMLYEGGYRKDVDDAISRIFLSHTLCKIKIIDKAVLDAVVDALGVLEQLKAEL